MKALREVESYYDRNTQAFASFGQGGGAIHRAVWGDGVRTRAEAFHYVDRVLLREIERLSARALEPLQVLDLGCGVGSSLFYLASQAAFQGTGVTLSGVQARWAQAASEQSGLAERLKFIQGNFLELPSTVPRAHLAFSIEAFVHSPDPSEFFAAAARYLAADGLLVICDDFLTARGASNDLSSRQQRDLEEVRTGWLANSLVSVATAVSIAAEHGFRLVMNQDLSSYLELRRPRDRVISLLVELGRPFRIPGYRWRSWVGGNALQLALQAGLLEYRLLTWQKLAG